MQSARRMDVSKMAQREDCICSPASGCGSGRGGGDASAKAARPIRHHTAQLHTPLRRRTNRAHRETELAHSGAGCPAPLCAVQRHDDRCTCDSRDGALRRIALNNC